MHKQILKIKGAVLLMKEKKAAVLPFLISGIIGALFVFMILLLSASAIVSMGSLDTGLFIPLNMVSLCVGSFVGGWICARFMKEKGLICGALCALVIFVFTAAVLLIIGGEPTIQLFLRLLIMLPSGAIGGVLGVNRKKKRRR